MKRFALKISALLLLLSTAVILLAACGKVEFKVDFIVDDVDNSMEMQSIIRQIFGNREYDESREISFLMTLV